MIYKNEFYFIRHGQTDDNISETKADNRNISLNATGLQQAHAIEGVIASLPVKSVCYSPLNRAKETKEVISLRLQASHHEILDLEECSLEIWDEMTACGANAHRSTHKPIKDFMQRALNGVNQALSREGPILIVAHGGIHWALCCLMGLADHEWAIDNCLPVHFFPDNNGRWKARKLI